jgi:anaerobic selenocysteine-containing dehydrogenase
MGENDIGAVQIRYGACNLCEAICGLEFKVQNNRIISVRGDEADPLSRGHICPKAVALKDLHEDPARLRRPVKRVGDDWQQIGWDEAFDLVVDRLLAVREKYGNNAIAAYSGNPSVHNYGTMTHSSALLGPLKTRSRFSATSVDQLPHQLVAYWMYGHQLLLPIPDIDHTQYFLVLGANPLASNGSLMTVPDFRNRLKALQARGGRMVVIDPRRSETAAVADEHHFIRPGSDVLFLFALLNTLFEENLCRPERLAGFTDGLDTVRVAISGFSPERAERATGIAAATIRRTARDFAAAGNAVCYGRMGVSTQAYGTLCQWAIQLINLVTGNLDRRGGALFTAPAVDTVGTPDTKPGHYGAWHSRVRQLPEFAGELPVAALAEEILTPGEGQIRALVTIAGNPVLSTPNGRQLDTALESLDFMVAFDIYINETTQHADVILPPTCGVEHDHYDFIFHHFAVRNTARYSEPVVEREAGTLHDWEIFTELGKRLAARLDGKPPMPLRPDQIMDMGLRMGPYGDGRKHPLGLSLKKLKEHPHGIDIGPLEPSMPARLHHQDKRIAAAPAALLQDLHRAERELLGADADTSLRLIGRRHVRSNNSWMHNFDRLVKGKPRHQLLMNPADFAARGLDQGSRVRVRSRVGEIEVEVAASDEMMPGVVSLPHGWGHARDGVRMPVAQAQPGVSVNDLTDDRYLDALSGNAALNGLAVEVSRIA